MKPWAVSAKFDAVFFVGSLAVPLLMWAAFALGLWSGVAVYVAFQLLFNMPHNAQTWTMSLIDAHDRAEHGKRYLAAAAILLAVFALPMWLSPRGIYPYVLDALLYWGYYHLVRQHQGILRIYDRRLALLGSGPSEREQFWTLRFIDVVSYAPLLARFADAEWMTIAAGGQRMVVHHVALPAMGAWLLQAAFIAACAAMAAALWLQARRGVPVLAKALFLTAVAACFGIAGFAVQDFLVASAIVTTYHNLQYLGLVWFHNRNRAERDEPGLSNWAIAWLRSRRFAPYIAVSLLYGVVLFLPRIALGNNRFAQLPVMLVVGLHYYVDSRIWRFRERKGLAQNLKLAG